jgi:hypothetical protein
MFIFSVRNIFLDILNIFHLYNFFKYLRNLVLAIKNSSLIENYKNGILIKEMGLKNRIILNPLIPSHLNIIQDQNQTDDNILGIIHYVSEENLVILSNNILLINFFFFTFKKKFTLFTTKELKLNKEIKQILLNDKIKINDYIKSNTFILDDFKIIKILPRVKNISILSKKIIINKEYRTYKYLNGRLFKLNSKNQSNYFLITKKKYLKTLKRNKISAFSTIKSLELYPFDLCYESILPYIDELIIGVDNAFLTKKRRQFLKEFLLRTKYRNKIKIIYLNFKLEIFSSFKSRGRWIANINNYLLNYCTGKYCFYLQADEFNADKNLRMKFRKLMKINIDEISFNFEHYIFNLWTKRNPKYISYNKAIRFFKNEYYFNSYDGYNFYKSNNLIFPKKVSTEFYIMHLSYILFFKKKIDSNFSKKNGLFNNITTQKKWFKDIHPIKAKNLLDYVENFNYLKSTKRIIKDSFKNNNFLKNFTKN